MKERRVTKIKEVSKKTRQNWNQTDIELIEMENTVGKIRLLVWATTARKVDGDGGADSSPAWGHTLSRTWVVYLETDVCFFLMWASDTLVLI